MTSKGFFGLACGVAVAGFALSAASRPASALTINPIYDTSITSRPNAAVIEAAFGTAASTLASYLGSNAVINVAVSWGSITGTAMPSNALGASQSPMIGAYTVAQVRQFLGNGPNLPVSPATPAKFFINTAEAKGLGLIPAAAPAIDGNVGFANNSYSFSQSNIARGTYDFIGIAEHELSEVLGRISGLGYYMATPYDLFRYAAPGVSQYSTSTAAYFSLDRGVTDMGDFNANRSGDRSDWKTTSVTVDMADAFAVRNHVLVLSATDIAALQALGYGAGVGSPSSGGALKIATLTAASVPEPAVLGVLAVGLAGLLALGRPGRRTVSS